MIVAPELFTPSHAMDALRLADAVLKGPLGMKTLDPSDMQYRPDYDNSNDGEDQSIAKGWNVSLRLLEASNLLTAAVSSRTGMGIPAGMVSNGLPQIRSFGRGG